MGSSSAVFMEKLQDEVYKGRIIGPFPERPLYELYTSPLHVIPKPGSTKVRMIYNLSYPHAGSVNDNIIEEAKPVHYCAVTPIMWLQCGSCMMRQCI